MNNNYNFDNLGNTIEPEYGRIVVVQRDNLPCMVPDFDLYFGYFLTDFHRHGRARV